VTERESVEMWAMDRRIVAVALVMGTLATACGGDQETPPQDVSSSPSGGMDMGEGGHGGGESQFAFGEPAEISEADRVVEVTATDDLMFDPSSVAVSKGETIEFNVSNIGTVGHEFVLGDASFQLAHEEEMADMEGDMLPPDEAYAISLAPGETSSIAWTFTSDGEIEYGCHVPGHYEGGMVGTVLVEG
jgi:uncharacterized cupredoxin-like copper-binding protein